MKVSFYITNGAIYCEILEKKGFIIMFFKSKEQKEIEQEKISSINNILVSTLPTCERPFEVVGIVTSGVGDAYDSFSVFMEEIKKEAYHLGADAVIGITFQTLSSRESYGTDRHEHVFSEIKSRAVGTAIKYI